MNKLQSRGGYAQWIWILVYMLVASIVGIIVPFEPMLMFAAVSGFTIFLMSVMYPEQMSYAICVSSVLSIQYIFPFTMAGMDLQSLYKIGILMLLLPAMFHYGIHNKQAMPIIGLLGILMITYLFSDRHPLLTTLEPVKSFIGLAAPFIFLLIRWKPSIARQHIRIICFMPIISIAFGTILHIAGIYPLFVTEFNGALRIQGANIPAHLAFLAFIAFLVSLIEIRRSPEKMIFYYMMTGVNFLILLLTGTRGPLVSAFLLVLVFLFDLIKQFIGGQINRIIPLFCIVIVLIGSVFWQLDNFKKRSFERSTDEMIDTSGRAEAWAFFLKGVEDSPIFGRGLGSVLVSNDGSIYEGFVVPHNEYIRFYYDGGWVGACLLFLALLYIFRDVYIRLEPELKPYFIAFIMGFLIYSITDNTLSTVQFTVPFCIYICALRNMADRQMSKEVTVYG
jgi:teichuronic acid biosynthesis protein TuaE